MTMVEGELQMQTITLAIQGMMCMKNCGTTVQNALRNIPGVQSAIVDYPTHSAKVICENTISPEFLVETIENIGFDALVLSPPSNPLIIDLLVEGMMCQKNCGSTVANALNQLEQVESAKVIFHHRLAQIILKEPQSLSLEKLIDTIECIGFIARPYDLTLAQNIREKDEKKKKMEETKDHVALDMSNNNNPSDLPRMFFKVEGMSCAACVKSIEDLLSKTTGVMDCRVGLIAQKAEIIYDHSLLGCSNVEEEKKRLQKCIEEAGYTAIFSHLVEAGEGDSIEVKFAVTGMSCAACVGKIETAVGKMPGITKVQVNFPLHKAHVYIQQMSATGPRDVMECINSLGYSAAIVTGATDQDVMTKNEVEKWRSLLLTALIFSIPAMLIHMVLDYIPKFHHVFMTPVLEGINAKMLLMFLLATPIQFGVGKRFYVAAWKGIQHGMMGMDFLIVLGTTASYLYSFISLVNAGLHKEFKGHYFFESSAMLLTFVTLGKYMESKAKGRTADALSELAKLQPKTAILVKEGEMDQEIPIELVQRGDLLRVLPGANIPADGIVRKGSSSCDESMLTGESMPVPKKEDDYVFGSTINQHGTLIIESSCVGGESSALSQICSLIEDAQLHKAPIQAYADKLASIFAPCVITLSSLTFATWYALLHTNSIPATWLYELGVDPAEGHDNDLYLATLFAISVVVIACPCALGLATPTAVMVGCGVGAKHGILIKGGRALEIARYADTIVFDKTGTLTLGHPSVTDVLVADRTYTPRQLLYYAASIERGSEHALGKAIVMCATEVERLPVNEPSNVHIIAGRGIEGFVPAYVQSAAMETVNIIVGNMEYIEEVGIEIRENVQKQMHSLEMQGKTVVCVCIEGKLAGIIAMADTPRNEAAHVIRCLKAMGLDVWLITGDNIRTASYVARTMGIDHVKAIALPGEKASQIKALQSRISPRTGRKHVVCMVGDGINDAPALAQADVGMAIGAGTQIAKAEADVILVKSTLSDVVVALDLAKVVFGRIRLNFFFSVAYNFIGIPLAAGAFFPFLHATMPPACAGLAMAFSSVSVVLSSLMLKRYQPPDVYSQKKMVDDFVADRKGIELKHIVRSKLNTPFGKQNYDSVPNKEIDH